MVPLTTKGKPDKSLHVLGTAMKRRKSRHHNGLVDENGMITSGQGIYCFDAGVEYRGRWARSSFTTTLMVLPLLGVSSRVIKIASCFKSTPHQFAARIT